MPLHANVKQLVDHILPKIFEMWKTEDDKWVQCHLFRLIPTPARHYLDFVPELSCPSTPHFPPIYNDLLFCLIRTQLYGVPIKNLSTILALCQDRIYISKRSEVIMSVVGAIDRYKEHLNQFGTPSPETNLVVDMYPTQFVQGLVAKLQGFLFKIYVLSGQLST